MIFVKDNWKSEARHQDYITFLRDSSIKEAVELLKESGNKVNIFQTTKYV
jgi:hypothetical protein